MTDLKLRELLPELVKSNNYPWMMRHGLASILQASVELTSLGKMTADWTLNSTFFAEDKTELRKFLEHVSNNKPHLSFRRRHMERADLMAGSIVRLAEGTVELLTLGRVTTRWTMLWMCYGDDLVDWCAEKLGQDR